MIQDSAAAVSASDSSANALVQMFMNMDRSDDEIGATIKRWQVSPENSIRPPIPALSVRHDGMRWKGYTGIYNEVFEIPQATAQGAAASTPLRPLATLPFNHNVYRLILQPWVSDQPIAHMFASEGQGLFGPARVIGHDSAITWLDAQGKNSAYPNVQQSYQGLSDTVVDYDFDLAGETGFMAGVPGYTDGVIATGSRETNANPPFMLQQPGFTKRGAVVAGGDVIVIPGNPYIGEKMADVGLHPAQPGSGWGVKPGGFSVQSVYPYGGPPFGSQVPGAGHSREWPVGCCNPAFLWCNLVYTSPDFNANSKLANLVGLGAGIPGIFPDTNATPLAWPFSTDFAVASFEGGYLEVEITVANGATCKVSCCGSNQIRNFGMHTLDGTAGGATNSCGTNSSDAVTRSSGLSQLRRAFIDDVWINGDDFYFDDLACTAGKLSLIAGYDNIVMGGESMRSYNYSIPFAMGAAGLMVMKAAFLPEHGFSQYYQGSALPGITGIKLYVFMAGDAGNSAFPTANPGINTYTFPELQGGSAQSLYPTPLGTAGILYPDNGHLGVQSMWEADAGLWYSSFGSTQPVVAGQTIVRYPQSTYPVVRTSNPGQGMLLSEGGPHGDDDRGSTTTGVTIARATRIVRACNSLAQSLYAGMPQLEIINTTPISTTGSSVTVSFKMKTNYNFVIRHDSALWSSASPSSIKVPPHLLEGRNLIRPAVGRSSVSAADARDNMRTLSNAIRKAKGTSHAARNQGAVALPSVDPAFNRSSGIEAENLERHTPNLSLKTLMHYAGMVAEGSTRFAEQVAQRLGLGNRYDIASRVGDGLMNAGVAAAAPYLGRFEDMMDNPFGNIPRYESGNAFASPATGSGPMSSALAQLN